MKKLFINILLIFSIVFIQNIVQAASPTAQLNKGAKYYSEHKYPQAIQAFAKAIKIEPKNLQARLGIANSYIAKGDYYFSNKHEWGMAANEYRSALFYLKYFPPKIESAEINSLIAATDKKLNGCYKKLCFKKYCYSRYSMAQILDVAGVYTAAAYEYTEAARDSEYREKCQKRIEEIIKFLNK